MSKGRGGGERDGMEREGQMTSGECQVYIHIGQVQRATALLRYEPKFWRERAVISSPCVAYIKQFANTN